MARHISSNPRAGRWGAACVSLGVLLHAWCVSVVAQDGWVPRGGSGPLPQRGQPTARGDERPPTGIISTAKRRFRIPYTIDRDKQAVREVRLYLSRDQGLNWQLQARQSAQQPHFEYTAPEDGEYWFASRTVDQYERLWPQSPLQPELKIVVDATQPAAEFDAYLQRDGTIQMRWSVSDQGLRPESLQVQYRVGQQGPWLDVPRPQNIAWGQSRAQGELVWQPPEESAGPLELRLQASDRAGNLATAGRRILPPNVPGAESPANLASRRPLANTPAPPVQRGAPSTFAGGPLRTAPGYGSLGGGGDGGAPRDPYATVLPNSDWINHSAVPPDAANRNASPGDPSSVGPAALPPSPSQHDAGSFRSARQGMPNTPPEPQVIHPMLAGRGGDPEAPPSLAPIPTDGSLRALPSHPIVQSNTSSSGGQTTAQPAWPGGEQPLVVNRLTFALDYELDDLPSDAIALVQLWGTDDGGATWSAWGIDEDRQSPVEVQVLEEGMFGFRIVASNRNGLTSRPPSAGDRADIWIRVDATPPQCMLTAAMYGTGVQAGQLDIRWEASDANLLPRPVSLYYGNQPQGPWEIIEQGIPNTGQYYWSVDPSTPSPIYLRLEVKDLAGNRGEHQLTQSISLDGLRPKARIRRLAPQGAVRP